MIVMNKCGAKYKAKYVMDLHQSIGPIGADPSHAIENEAALLTRATLSIEGRKEPIEARHGSHIGGKSTGDGKM
eukprot:8550798-Ditylum_brightwellii.AAC.1